MNDNHETPNHTPPSDTDSSSHSSPTPVPAVPCPQTDTESNGTSDPRRVSPALPKGQHDTRDPKDLDEHPLLRRLFPNGLGDDDEQAEMAASVEKLQRSPILITGTGCQGTPPNFVLDGRRVRRAALKAGRSSVEVVVFDDLTEDQQAALIVHANLAAGMARRLDERQKAALEHYLLDRIGKRQGKRTSLAGEGSEAAKGAEWPEVIASELKGMDPSSDATPNAIRERHLIFYSSVSSEVLKQRFVEGKVTRKDAVAKIREALKQPEVISALREAREKDLPPDVVAEHPAIVAVKSAIFHTVESKNEGMRQPRPKVTKPVKAEGLILDGACDIDNFDGNRVHAEIQGNRLVLIKVGVADSDASSYCPDKPVTRSCWAIDVSAAVDMLPGDLRSQVTSSSVEQLDPVKCPSCGGTVWRWDGGCAKCQANSEGFSPTMSTRLPRERVRLSTPKGDLDVVLWPNVNHYMAWIPADKAKGGITVGRKDICPIKLDSAHCDDSRRAFRAKVEAALTALLSRPPGAPDESGGEQPASPLKQEVAAAPSRGREPASEMAGCEADVDPKPPAAEDRGPEISRATAPSAAAGEENRPAARVNYRRLMREIIGSKSMHAYDVYEALKGMGVSPGSNEPRAYVCYLLASFRDDFERVPKKGRLYFRVREAASASDSVESPETRISSAGPETESVS